jgi:hypothetical protein
VDSLGKTLLFELFLISVSLHFLLIDIKALMGDDLI